MVFYSSWQFSKNQNKWVE